LARISAITCCRLAKFGWISFAVSDEAECKIYGKWLKFSVLFYAVCGPKLTKFKFVPLVLSNVLTRLSIMFLFIRYSQLSLKVVEKPNKYQRFLTPNFGGEIIPTFLPQIVSAIYCPPFGKAWLSSVCWSPSVKPVNKVKCRINGGWIKCRSNFKPFLDQRSSPVETMYQTLVLVIFNDCVYHVSFRKYRLLKSLLI